MPLSLDLSTTLQFPATQNDNASLAIAVSDTVTVTVNANYPRTVLFTCPVAWDLKKTPSAVGFPSVAGGSVQLQIAVTTTFTVTLASASTIHLLVVK